MPRRRHLHGGWLHRILGERLFDPELWKPTRRGLAGGLALGLFIGFTPTMGVQIILAGVAAYLLRVNVPVAIAASLVTNPFTAAVVYPLEYQLGVWLIGVPDSAELEGMTLAMRGFIRYGQPLWAGSLFIGTIAAVLGYVAGSALWTVTHRSREARKARRRALARSKQSSPVGGDAFRLDDAPHDPGI